MAKPKIVAADGITLTDEEGKTYLDCISSWWVNLHGHKHPTLLAAMQKQMEAFAHSIFSGFSHAPAEELGTALCHAFGGMGKVFYSDDGSTAVEVAIKMAIHSQAHSWAQGKPRRKRIVCLANSYHGDTVGAMSVAEKGLFTLPYSAMLFDTLVLPMAYGTDIDAELDADEKAQLEACLQLLEAEDLAAIIYEPMVQGAGGMRLQKRAYTNAILAKAKAEGLLLIADEVMTGFGRTGRLFASEYLDTKPDLVCLSKGLTGGMLPLGATLATDVIYEVLGTGAVRDRFLHGHSFTANPIACAVALASFRLLEGEICKQQRKFLEQRLSQMAIQLGAQPRVENVRALGCMLAFDIKTKERTGYMNSMRNKAYAWFLAHGLLMRPLGNTLYLLPPYSSTAKELLEMETKILAFLQSE